MGNDSGIFNFWSNQFELLQGKLFEVLVSEQITALFRESVIPTIDN